jgi:hypothetical protein
MQNKLTVAKKAMWVVCCQTGVASNFVFWTFSYVVVIGLALNYIISSKGIKQSASFNLKY